MSKILNVIMPPPVQNWSEWRASLIWYFFQFVLFAAIFYLINVSVFIALGAAIGALTGTALKVYSHE